MKKLLPIALIAVLLAFGLWILFRDSDSPLVETVRDSLPFGSDDGISIPANLPAEDTVGVETPFDSIDAETQVFRISNTPVAGFVVIGAGATTTVRFADRATGHISDAILPNESGEIIKRKVTNQTLPKIYEALFRADGNAVIFRSLRNDSDEIENLSLLLTPPRATSTDALYTIAAVNLRGNIDEIAVGAGDTIFYSAEDTSSINSSTFAGGGQRTLFTLPFTNWRLSRFGNSILVSTKASAGALGYAYSLPAGGGNLNKIAGPLNGLTAVGSVSGSHVLYSHSQGARVRLVSKTIQSGAESEITPATLAEKCVWSARENGVFYCGTPIAGLSAGNLDGWYLGRTNFSDFVWRFDTRSELAELIAEPKTDYGLDLDVYEPKLSPNEEFLIFINKRDLTLWGMRI